MTEAARIGRNLGAIAFAQVTAQGLAFAVSIAVTRTLGVEPYGVFVFGFAFPSWFVLVVSLGLDYVVTIDVAADRTKASAYLTAVSAVRIPLVLLAVLALWVSLQFVVADPFARSVVMILGVANLLSAYNMTFDSLFRAHERLDFSALVIVGERTIATVAVVVLLALGHGLLAVSAVYAGSVLVATGLSLVVLKRRVAWFARPLDLAVVRHVLRRAPPFALSALVAALMYSTAPVLLTFLQGPVATGHFNAGFVLLLALMAPLQMYNIVFLPRMARLHRHSPDALPSVLRRTQRLFFALGLPVAFGGFLYAEPLLTGLYGDAFLASAPVFAVLVLVLAVATASLGAGTALGATDRAVLDLRFGAVGALANVVLCLLLIPPLGPVGSAWAFLVAMTVIAALRLGATSRHIAPYSIVETTARAWGAGALMVFALLVLARPSLLAGIGVGAAVYFGGLAALRGVTREDLAIVGEIVRGVFVSPERVRH